jgi:hypothetical protein
MGNILSQKEFDKIKSKCTKYGISDYEILSDGSIDVHNSVLLRGHKFTKLPVVFNKVDGSFHISCDKLVSLEGCPKHVGGDFIITFMKNITSLEGCPKYVGLNFNCSHTGLTSLQHAPSYVGGLFDCKYTYTNLLDYMIPM